MKRINCFLSIIIRIINTFSSGLLPQYMPFTDTVSTRLMYFSIFRYTLVFRPSYKGCQT